MSKTKTEVTVVRSVILYMAGLPTAIALAALQVPLWIGTPVVIVIVYGTWAWIKDNELRHHARQLVEGLSGDKDS